MTSHGRPGGPRFADRTDAGHQLGTALRGPLHQALMTDLGAVLLGLPRGGVVVAAAAAEVLGAPLGTYPVRKVRSPRNPELAVGAVTADGTTLLNDQVVRAESLGGDALRRMVDDARALAEADRVTYGVERSPGDLAGRVAVLVDDGAATGATVRACLAAARAAGSAEVVVALPVAPRETLAVLDREADRVVCLRRPLLFRAVGWAYEDFGEVATDDVQRMLDRATPPGR
jgi:predicted phosphoribosyltransferase